MHWCNNLGELIDFLAYVSLYAPNDFPDEDGERLDLQSAFCELEYGMAVGLTGLRDQQKADEVRRLVSSAQRLYAAGNDVDAASALIEAEYLLRGRRKPTGS